MTSVASPLEESDDDNGVQREKEGHVEDAVTGVVTDAEEEDDAIAGSVRGCSEGGGGGEEIEDAIVSFEVVPSSTSPASEDVTGSFG